MYSVTPRKAVHVDEVKAKTAEHLFIFTMSQSKAVPPKEAVPVALQILVVNFSLILSPCALMHRSWAGAEKCCGTVKDNRNSLVPLAYEDVKCLLKYCLSFGPGAVLYAIQFTMLKYLGMNELIST